MANYCSNDIEVRGENVLAVAEYIRDGQTLISFQKIMPRDESKMPKEGEFFQNSEQREETYKWGVGAEPTDIYLHDLNDSYMCICFETRWTYPDKIIDALREKFKNNTFKLSYHEPNEGLKGVY